MSWLSSGVKQVFGGSPGVQNPFGIPDLSFLKNPVDLTKNFKPIDTGKSDATFQNLLTNIGGQNQNDTEALNNLLGQIGIDENNTVGSTKSDFLDRGLGGPGQISDIEANAIAQNRSDANRTRANARTTTIGQGLDRLASAYGTKYQGDLGTEGANASTYNDLLKTGGTLSNDNLDLLAKLLSGQYQEGASNQIKSSFPSPFFDSFGKSFGENLGKNAAGGTSDVLKALLAGG